MIVDIPRQISGNGSEEKWANKVFCFQLVFYLAYIPMSCFVVNSKEMMNKLVGSRREKYLVEFVSVMLHLNASSHAKTYSNSYRLHHTPSTMLRFMI